MGDRTQAISFYNAAVKAHNDGPSVNPDHLQVSYNLFASAVLADPTWAEAWYQLGNNNSDLNLLPASIACYRRVLECMNNE